MHRGGTGIFAGVLKVGRTLSTGTPNTRARRHQKGKPGFSLRRVRDAGARPTRHVPHSAPLRSGDRDLGTAENPKCKETDQERETRILEEASSGDPRPAGFPLAAARTGRTEAGRGVPRDALWAWSTEVPSEPQSPSAVRQGKCLRLPRAPSNSSIEQTAAKSSGCRVLLVFFLRAREVKCLEKRGHNELPKCMCPSGRLAAPRGSALRGPRGRLGLRGLRAARRDRPGGRRGARSQSPAREPAPGAPSSRRGPAEQGRRATAVAPRPARDFSQHWP